jgi:uncharacterized GH25 family protein
MTYTFNRWLCLAAFCLAPLAPLAQAHEFWITPVTASLKVGDTARLTLEVGEYFEGEVLPISSAQTASSQQFSKAGARDLTPALGQRGANGSIPVALSTPGTNLVTFEGHPNLITLSADTFNAYLHDEGLDFVKAERQRIGKANSPGRERYRRHVKTLLRVDPAADSDAVASVVVGQRLELVPLNNPLSLKPGGTLTLKVLFEGQPLAGTLVKAWHKRTGQTLTVRARSNAQGEVSLDLPHPGAWMVSAVHMVAVTGSQDADWDSFWANLSFGLNDSK